MHLTIAILRVEQDKDREYYLGHSLNAPVGRWQQGKDLTWYNKDRGDAEEAERQRREELKRIKEAEEDALSQALYATDCSPNFAVS